MTNEIISRGNEDKKKSLIPVAQQIFVWTIIVILSVLLTKIANASDVPDIHQAVKVEKTTKIASFWSKPLALTVKGYHICKNSILKVIHKVKPFPTKRHVGHTGLRRLRSYTTYGPTGPVTGTMGLTGPTGPAEPIGYPKYPKKISIGTLVCIACLGFVLGMNHCRRFYRWMGWYDDFA